MWPHEALEFMQELEDNNDRDWFRANRHRYDAYLFDPAVALGEQLQDLGPLRTFRPYNDTRFHPRPPIKEHLGLAIGYGNAGGYYVELSLDGLLVAAGLYRPAPDQLQRYRAAVDSKRLAAKLDAAFASATAAGLELAEPSLKRAPRGYPSDHPRLDRLRMKELIVHRRHELEPWLHSTVCVERLRTELEAAQPLVTWLAEYVGPPQRPGS